MHYSNNLPISKCHLMLNTQEILFSCKYPKSQTYLVGPMAQTTAVKVEVLEVCPLAPPQRSAKSTAPTSLSLAFFDLLWLRFPPPQCLCFYEFPQPKTSVYDSLTLPTLPPSRMATSFGPTTGPGPCPGPCQLRRRRFRLPHCSRVGRRY